MATASQRGWERTDAPQRPVLFIDPRSGGGRAGRAHLGRRCPRQVDRVGRPAAGRRPWQSRRGGGGERRRRARHGRRDGSLAAVASIATAHGLPFVCVPAGTRNHFARDLGLDPNDLIGALGAFADPLERRIDLGDVNGRVFLNNMSLGVYGAAVQRESYRDAKARTLLRPLPRDSVRVPNCRACASRTIVGPPHRSRTGARLQQSLRAASAGAVPHAGRARRRAAGSARALQSGSAAPSARPRVDRALPGCRRRRADSSRRGRRRRSSSRRLSLHDPPQRPAGTDHARSVASVSAIRLGRRRTSPGRPRSRDTDDAGSHTSPPVSVGTTTTPGGHHE